MVASYASTDVCACDQPRGVSSTSRNWHAAMKRSRLNRGLVPRQASANALATDACCARNDGACVGRAAITLAIKAKCLCCNSTPRSAVRISLPWGFIGGFPFGFAVVPCTAILRTGDTCRRRTNAAFRPSAFEQGCAAGFQTFGERGQMCDIATGAIGARHDHGAFAVAVDEGAVGAKQLAILRRNACGVGNVDDRGCDAVVFDA